MAYGFTMPPGKWWPKAIDNPRPDLANNAKFAVMEWAVLPTMRRSGIGRTLMANLLADRTEPYATLLVNPRAQAHDIYQRWGWSIIGQVRTAHEPMAIMVLGLPSSQ